MTSPATVQTLQRRISEMQPVRLDERTLPTLPALAPLLPGGALHAGASYTVQGSQQLALSFLAAASSTGSWCGVIGCPDFGAEAAATLGVALDRCVLIPAPGRDAVALAGALSEVLTLVLLCAPAPPRGGEGERLSARLREHGSALIVLGDWPHPEGALEVVSSRWAGLGSGWGILTERDLVVRSRDRRGTREHAVHFAHGSPAVRETSPLRRVDGS